MPRNIVIETCFAGINSLFSRSHHSLAQLPWGGTTILCIASYVFNIQRGRMSSRPSFRWNGLEFAVVEKIQYLSNSNKCTFFVRLIQKSPVLQYKYFILLYLPHVPPAYLPAQVQQASQLPLRTWQHVKKLRYNSKSITFGTGVRALRTIQSNNPHRVWPRHNASTTSIWASHLPSLLIYDVFSQKFFSIAHLDKTHHYQKELETPTILAKCMPRAFKGFTFYK